MKAVVLVGGQGTRLRPLTLTTPKQMLPIARRPMIERVVAHLAGFGIDEVVLSLGYRPDAFLAAYPDGRCGPVRLQYAVEDHPLDTAGAIAFAAREAGIGETFVVVNGDVLTGLDVGALLAVHARCGGLGTIALTPVDDPSAFGVVPTDAEGRVIAFIEKPPRDRAPTNLINAGTYVLEAGVLDRIPAGRKVSIERETFPLLVEERALYAMASDAYWVDAGIPATYLSANLNWTGEIPEDLRVTVDPTATVIGSRLGDDSVIGAGAVIEDSVLLEGARVGAGAVIRSSLLGRSVHVGERAQVTDLSVIGDRVEIPAGASVSAQLLAAPVP